MHASKSANCVYVSRTITVAGDGYTCNTFLLFIHSLAVYSSQTRVSSALCEVAAGVSTSVHTRRLVSMSEKACLAGQPRLSAKGQPRSMGPPTTVWFKVCCHSAVIHSFIPPFIHSFIHSLAFCTRLGAGAIMQTGVRLCKQSCVICLL